MHQHRTNERAPPSVPCCSESACLVVRAPAKLGRLHSGPRQANGALGSALPDRAGASSNVALLVSAVACTGFRVHQHRTNERASPSRTRCSESACLVARAPVKLGRLHLDSRQANSALSSALPDRAGASSNVVLLVSAVACTGFRVHQHRTNERAPPSVPCCSESACLVVRAPAKLGTLHSGPKQANGALGSALPDRAGASSNVVLLVSAVACTGFHVHQHRTNERAPPTAPCRTERARVKIESARAVPCAGRWCRLQVLGSTGGRWAPGPLHKPRPERGQAHSHLACLQ